MTKNLVIYHANCLDGITAAAIALDALHTEGGGVEAVPAAYGDTPPDVKDRRVYIVDFSYPRKALMEMHDQAEFLVVLDHHKTAAKDLEGLRFATFDMNKSGAGLTWDYFKSWDLFPGVDEAPKLVKHVEDRDLWRFKLPNTKAFCAALKLQMGKRTEAEKLKYADALIDMDGRTYRQMLEEGDLLLEYQDALILSICSKAYLKTFNDQLFMFVNAPRELASEVGNFLCDVHDLPACVYHMDGTKIMVSLRSRNDLLDVSEVAQKYGGGGHRNAAGFSTDIMFAPDFF